MTNLTLGDDSETRRRSAEVACLMAVVEPDPAFHPSFVSDLATFYDVSGDDEATIKARLESFLGQPLPAPLTEPIWRFVDAVRSKVPGWHSLLVAGPRTEA